MATKIKMRTNRSAAKRFRLTGTGKIRRTKAGGNHGLSNKNRKRLRRLRDNDTIATCMEKRIKHKLIPYG